MQIITDADFRRALKGDISGGFLFFGDEDYLKLHALRSAREAVCPDPSLEIFNDIRIDGSEFDPAALANALPTLPVMADKKLIEVTGLDMSGVKRPMRMRFSRSLRRRPTTISISSSSARSRVASTRVTCQSARPRC